MTMTTGATKVRSHDELRELLGEPGRLAVSRERTSLHEVDRRWLAAPFFGLPTMR